MTKPQLSQMMTLAIEHCLSDLAEWKQLSPEQAAAMFESGNTAFEYRLADGQKIYLVSEAFMQQVIGNEPVEKRYEDKPTSPGQET